MMKMFTFQCTQHHDVVSRMVTSKNPLKARLRDLGVYDVSDDERLPAEPPSDFGFPSGPEWADSTRLVAVVLMMMMMRMISDAAMTPPLFLDI